VNVEELSPFIAAVRRCTEDCADADAAARSARQAQAAARRARFTAVMRLDAAVRGLTESEETT